MVVRLQQQKQVQKQKNKKPIACLLRPLVNDFGLSPPLRIGRVEWEQLRLSAECLNAAVSLSRCYTGPAQRVLIVAENTG